MQSEEPVCVQWQRDGSTHRQTRDLAPLAIPRATDLWDESQMAAHPLGKLVRVQESRG